MKMIRCLALLLLANLAACSDSSSNKSPTAVEDEARASAATLYFQKSTSINVQVWYEEAAAPYVKETALDRDLWQILRGNLTAIFQYRSAPPSIVVPSTLAEMHKLPIAKQENWTSERILALAAAHQSGAVAEGTSQFYVYFLDGYLNDKGVSNKNVIGVQIGSSPVIAIFKPVISESSQGALLVPKFMEQSTLVHEMGHALGFVNHGVPMISSHQDVEHGAHTTDADCVMFWLNEGASDLKKFVQKLVTSESAVLWGPAVLEDAKAFSK